MTILDEYEKGGERNGVRCIVYMGGVSFIFIFFIFIFFVT